MAAEPGDIVYLAETQHVLFPLHDPSGITPNTDDGPHLSVIVDGVFSTVARAEAALDARLARYGGVRATSQLKAHAFGGLTDLHGGIVTWERKTLWDGPDGVSVEAWQQVSAKKIDPAP